MFLRSQQKKLRCKSREQYVHIVPSDAATSCPRFSAYGAKPHEVKTKLDEVLTNSSHASECSINYFHKWAISDFWIRWTSSLSCMFVPLLLEHAVRACIVRYNVKCARRTRLQIHDYWSFALVQSWGKPGKPNIERINMYYMECQ